MEYLEFSKEHWTTGHNGNTLHHSTSVGMLYALHPLEWEWKQALHIEVMFDIDIQKLGCFRGKTKIFQPKLIIKQKMDAQAYSDINPTVQ